MREVMPLQKGIDQTDIVDIKISPRSRDDVPDILKGLQYIYATDTLRNKLFTLLEGLFTEKQKRLGRAGMHLWRVFVFATLRVNLNWDYDRLQHMANEHRTIRKILGHGHFDDDVEYSLQTLKDNVQMLTPEILDDINQAIVASGHELVKKKDDTILSGRCDSFVVETDVHFPTDIGLLFDALRKGIQLTRDVCKLEGLSDWRQSAYNIRCIKMAWRKAQQSKRGGGKDKPQRIVDAHQAYIDLGIISLEKLQVTFEKIKHNIISPRIQPFLDHAQRQINQIKRRIIDGEVIPSCEKVYSLFAPHTEWINKGKAGGKIELGLKVCIMEDQHRFILHHRVMEKEADAAIAVKMVQYAKDRFPALNTCSFDKGFDSSANQAALNEIIETVTMPKKGKLSQSRYDEEHEDAFRKTRDQHSAVESAINCLEHHGLDKCLDKGIVGFKRYVALSIVGRNIQRIGALLRAEEFATQKKRRRKRLKAA